MASPLTADAAPPLSRPPLNPVDLIQLSAGSPPGDGFFALPFAVKEPGTAPSHEVAGCWPSYNPDRLALLRGLDWFMSKRLDVVRLSLGFHQSFDPSEPLQVALRALVDAGTTVVVAAGNRGPAADSLQELARDRHVLSVGATDGAGALLRSSSRGVPGESGPTVVAEGIDHMENPMYPGTSFSAPRVAQVAGFIGGCLHLSVLTLRAAVQGPWNPLVRVPLPQTGFADTGLSPDFHWPRGPIAKSIIAAGGSAVEMTGDDRHRSWFEQVVHALANAGLRCDVAVNPAVVSRTIRLLARPMVGDASTVGAGFVDARLATDFIRAFTPSRWLAVFCPDCAQGPAQSAVAKLDSDLGALWDPVEMGVLIDAFLTGQISSVARVIGNQSG